MKEKFKRYIPIIAIGAVFAVVLITAAMRSYTNMAVRDMPSLEERLYGVSQIWKKASDHYGLWGMADTEPTWDEAYEIAYREAADAETSREYYLALKKFIAHLHDGHAESISTDESVWENILPFQMTYRNDQYVITMVYQENAEDFPLGSIVRTIDGTNTADYLEEVCGSYIGVETPGVRQQLLAQFLLGFGLKGEEIELELEVPGQSEVRVETAAWETRKAKVNALEQTVTVDGELLYQSDGFVVKRLDGNLAYVDLSQRDAAYIDEYFRTVVPLIQDCDGVILDIRTNSGGNGLVGRVILESFTGGPFEHISHANGNLKCCGKLKL